MNPGLYVVGTPIGHLSDISARALETLREADVIFAEDTRHSRRLLDRYQIPTPLVSCHKFNEASRLDAIASRIRQGQAVALVTDAGMPGVSDPGARTVRGCREAGLALTVIPGPSAVTAAAALSGMVDGGFVFDGFLSHKEGARRRRLADLGNGDLPLILFESPFRLVRLMNDIESALGERRVFVGRELTKQFEECLCGAPREIRDAYANRRVRGEIVVVIAPAPREKRRRPDAESEAAE